MQAPSIRVRAAILPRQDRRGRKTDEEDVRTFGDFIWKTCSSSRVIVVAIFVKFNGELTSNYNWSILGILGLCILIT